MAHGRRQAKMRGSDCLWVLLLLTACSPSPRWIAVAGDSGVTWLDGELRVIALQPAPGRITGVLFAPDGASLFLTVSPHARVTRLVRVAPAVPSLAGDTLAGEARAMRLVPDGSRLLAALAGSLVEAQPHTLRSRRTEVPCDARDVVLSPSADRGYLLCREGTVVETDLHLHIVARSASLPGGIGCDPAGGGLSRNGSALLVACAASGIVWYLDRATLAPFDSVPVPTGATRLVMAPGHRRGLLVVPGMGIVAVDFPARAARQVLSAPEITDVAVAADGRNAFAITPTHVIAFDVTEAGTGRARPLPQPAAVVAVWPGPGEPRVRWDHEELSASVSVDPIGK